VIAARGDHLVANGSPSIVRVATRPRFRWWDYPIFTVVTTLYLVSAAVFADSWIDTSDWQHLPVIVGLLTVLLAMGIVMYGVRLLSLPLMREPVPLTPPAGLRVAAVTTFVPAAEPVEMLEETLTALVCLDYPHDTWVLDEGDDPTVRALCERLGVLHFSRRRYAPVAASPVFEQRTKHGNYNEWLYRVGFDAYDAVLTIDPDHIPMPHFLTSTLGYLRDPDVGYVQAAQVYYNQSFSFIARGAAEETFSYYSSTMMTSYAGGYPIVTGCHTLHRVTALRDVGGLAPHDADDLLITLHYQAKKWKGVYVPERLAEGLAPVDWRGYLGQQRRWARSVLDIKLRLFPKLGRALPFRQRVLATMHGLYYLHGFATFAVIAILCVALAGLHPGVGASWTSILLLFLAGRTADFYRQRFFLLPQTEAGLQLRAAVLRYAKWPTVLIAALEALRGANPDYAVTPKKRIAYTRKVTRSHVVVLTAIVAAALVGVIRGASVSWVTFVLAACCAVASACIYATEHFIEPDPFDAGAARLTRERLMTPHPGLGISVSDSPALGSVVRNPVFSESPGQALECQPKRDTTPAVE
jgi:cellulose synthase (UDP-forming)